ncbi:MULTISPECIES: hypothetical protein [Geobacillus]|uniref:Conserved hypothetical ATP-binding protein n=1 Tax=Geobacillus stearothermophilus TaxID=1422 RepID=A0A916NZZ4_GEOSE|nr:MULTISPECIES: hypothetical protein [Geobacillus]KZM56293.1 hypothetical protein A3Q36_06015 [Geobacillus stearothermophilus]TWG24953.1 tRNA(Ile)-lysidine synthase TilS/MesJ [Geobacillus sp. C56-T2]CAP08236.1 conserved hypothetical ATP-binding protein [Geobacillus stearothermophilus]
MAQVIYKDKLGRMFTFDASKGQKLSDVLYSTKIPRNSVTARKGNKIVTEDIILQEDDIIYLEMNRGYDLVHIMLMETEKHETQNPIYTKPILWFKNGNVHRIEKQFNEESLAHYIETQLANTLITDKMIEENDHIVLGFSGGRDSTAFLVARQKILNKLPNHKITNVTLRGLPDWDDETAFGYTKELSNKFGIEQYVVEPEDIQQEFNLKAPISEVLDELLHGPDAMHVIWIGHHMIRHMLRRAAERLNANKVALALNEEDCLATVLSCYSTGYLTGAMPVRRIGNIDYIYPLWLFPKKELNLYLYSEAEHLTKQGPPSRFNVGPALRHFYYAMTDYMQDIWPGIEHHFYHGFRNLQKLWNDKITFSECKNCGGTLLNQIGYEPPELCDVCQLFEEYGAIDYHKKK